MAKAPGTGKLRARRLRFDVTCGGVPPGIGRMADATRANGVAAIAIGRTASAPASP
ncbi:hypothetical protein [Burkholderia sp. Bp9031]|uniref:hypothetical protein n=1 Tax=Burkholderia sp. Bp9031 TaxID=2184566 RepID=UPI00158CE8A2|nr:hypothetical protein [Burkholderia sp. Bp9031]